MNLTCDDTVARPNLGVSKKHADILLTVAIISSLDGTSGMSV